MLGKVAKLLSKPILSTLCILALGTEAFGMDIRDHDLLIQKLELVRSEVRGKSSESDFLIRLGDLYSDRARLKFNGEIEKSCNNCLGSIADRKQAIQYYNSAIQINSQNQSARVTSQLVYLYTASGQEKEARKLLNKIVSQQKRYTPDAVGQAYFSLGELEYNAGHFKSALKYYAQAEEYPVKNREFISYRMAWSELNSDQLQKGKQRLVRLLRSSKIQGQAFHADVARDLVTFVAKGRVNKQSIQELMDVTPEDQRKPNLYLLGQECDRLGNKKGSLLVWHEYASLPSTDRAEKLAVHIRTAQNLLDQGHRSDALSEYKVSDIISKQENCAKTNVDECGEYNQRSRTFIYNWIKKEKSKPSVELLEALETYVATYADDLEILNWTGNISRFHKMNDRAAKYYGLTADSAQKGIRNNQFYHPTMSVELAEKIRTSAVDSEIVCAEDTGSDQLMKKAYLHYLQVIPDGPKSDEVQYQLTYLDYKQEKFKDSAPKFEALAVEENKLSQSMKIQAANLALKAYEASGSDSTVSQKAIAFSKKFPADSHRYLDVARKSILKQATQLSQQKKHKEAYGLLAAVPMAGANQSEKTQIIKDKIVLAEHLKDLSAVDSGANQLLLIKGLSASDKNFAYEKKLWVAESKLDFSGALKIAKAHTPRSLSAEQKYLKLAVLSELSGRSARPDYENYIKATSSIKKANLIRAKFVRESSRPWVELAKQKAKLRRTPEIYAAAVFDAYNREPNDKKAKPYITDRRIRNDSSLAMIIKKDRINTIQKLGRQVRYLSLNERSSAKLKASLDKKLSLLTQISKEIRGGAQAGDFTIQVVGSDILIREYRKLAGEIEKLSPPKSLKGEKREQYVELLKKQASPYWDDANKLSKQVDLVWEKSKYPRELIQLLELTPGQLDRTVEEELKTIARYSSRSRANSLNKQIEIAQRKISTKEVIQAKSEVKKDPFDSQKLTRLRDLEKKRGSETMVAFLEARLSALKSESL